MYKIFDKNTKVMYNNFKNNNKGECYGFTTH